MSKVWRRLQRVGKKATKYKFTTHSHILKINCNSKWQPERVCITWSRRERKISSKFAQWEPDRINIWDGTVYWEKSTDFLEFDVSLYRGINDDKFEQKEWILSVESEEGKGKRKLLASGVFNMNEYASIDPTYQTDITNMKLKTMSTKIKSVTVSFSLCCQFIKDGKATDEDMISIASFMSSVSTNTNNNNNNPYLNSNVMFQNPGSSSKLVRKSFHSNDTSNEDSRIEESENFTFEENDEFDLNSNPLIVNNFDRIQNNFGNNSIAHVDEPTPVIEQKPSEKDDFKQNFLKIFESNSNNNNSNNANLNNTNKSDKSNKENAKPTKPQAPVIKLAEINNVPPLQSASLNSPIQEKISKDLKNPFLDESIVNAENNPFVQEFSEKNPFLDSPSEKNPFGNPNEDNEETLNNESALIPCRNDPFNMLNSSSTSIELLDWCRDVVKKNSSKTAPNLFQNLQINDFSKSWMNGLALCSIIYSFRPNLIDIKLLSEIDAKKNLKQVFDASDAESIARVVGYSDFLKRDKLDQLSIMTFLFQLRDHFEKVKPIKKEAPFIPIKSSSTLSPTKNFCNKKDKKTKNSATLLTPANKNSAPIAPMPTSTAKLNTHNFKNPFDSDDESEINNNEIKEAKKSTGGLIRIEPNGNIVNLNEDTSAHETLDESSLNSKRKGGTNSLTNNSETFSSTTSLSKKTDQQTKLQHEEANVNKSDELIQKAKELIDKTKQNEIQKREEINQKVKQLLARRKSANTPTAPQKSSNSSNQSEDSYDENKTDHNSLIGTEYVNQEIINLKNEQKELDEQGNNLEQQIRILMKNNKEKKTSKEKELEDHLLKSWFTVVNRRNVLLHKQQELEILQNEKDLEKRYELLSNKLRALMQIEDHEKTDEQKRAEAILLHELINNVVKRNELVEQLDEENKLLNEGEIIDDYIQNRKTFQPNQDKSCQIQ